MRNEAMQRRKFLKETSYSVLGLAGIVHALSCENASAEPNGKTVVVVGAGMSGLVAAQKLKASGFEVIVLEAHAKIGGRITTNRTLGVPFDEGASWIHGVTRNPITDLAEKAGMSVFHTDDESRKSYDIGGIVRPAELYDSTEEKLDDVLKNLLKKGSKTKSFEEVFNANYPTYANDRLWRFLLSSYITFDTGDLDKLSSLLYDEGEVYNGVDKIAVNGYDTLATYLAKNIEIKLNERVTKIDYTAQEIKVWHTSAVSEADYVVVTVPLGVLKKKTIEFEPLLPTEKQEAIEKVGINCVNKFLLTWEIAFWDDVQYISYTPEAKDKFNYFLNIKKIHPSQNALMTFAYADYARKTETMTDAAVTNEIMAHLKDMYGSSIPYPTQLLRTKWNSNLNAFGSYSFTAVETEMKHFEILAKEVNNRLFFAGEHTEVDYFSTVHGAYLSGEREAQKIIELV